MAEPAPEAAPVRLYALYELSSKQCHHPVAEDHSVPGNFLFCGKPAVKLGYCEEHAGNRVSFEDRKKRNRHASKDRAHG